MTASGRDYGGAMQVVGDEPNHHLEHRAGATGGKGFEGEARPPLARFPMYVHWVGWLMTTNRPHELVSVWSFPRS